jgi:hypothetical protein
MQGGSSGIGYGLKYQSRCISDVKADTDYTSFLTGTLSLKEENEVNPCLDFDFVFYFSREDTESFRFLFSTI